jgi:hypothetical protein
MPSSTSSPPDAATSLAEAAKAAHDLATAAVLGGGTAAISDEAVQQLLTAGIKLFAAKTELERRYFSPLTAPHAATATEAATLVTELLTAVDLNLFDLSMWAARPRD